MAEKAKNDAHENPQSDELSRLKDEHARLKADYKVLEQRMANDRKSASDKIASIESAAERQREAFAKERVAFEQQIAILEQALRERPPAPSEEKGETKLVFTMRTRCMHKGKDRVFKKHDEYPVGDFSLEETEQYKKRGVIAPMVFAVAKPMANAIANTASVGVDPNWVNAQVPTRPAVPRHIG